MDEYELKYTKEKIKLYESDLKKIEIALHQISNLESIQNDSIPYVYGRLQRWGNQLKDRIEKLKE